MFEKGRILKEFCTLKVGGPAKYFFTAYTKDDLIMATEEARRLNIPVFLLGKGSNCLFDDRGFQGLVILNKWSECSIEGVKVRASAGYSFAYLGIKTAKAGLGGLEFASGIPGSVGGAVYMNAGANGQEVSHVIESCEIINSSGHLQSLKKEDIVFGYRYSSLQKERAVICSATFSLSSDPLAQKTQQKILDYRLKTQPYGEKSAGCIFQNPEGASAGQWIDALGLKGLSVGDAEVSQLHGNFIINKGSAMAEDIYALIEEIQKRIEAHYGKRLEMEVKCVPYKPRVHVSG